METITHTDRRGRVWRFGIDCSRPQYDTIRGALAAVRNMGNRHALSISGIMEAERNGELFASIENAMLQGLAERFPEPQRPEVVTLRQQRPPAPLPLVPAAPTVPNDPAEESPRGYWWEDM